MGAQAGDDFVVDGGRGARPVVGQRIAVASGSEEDGEVSDGRGRVPAARGRGARVAVCGPEVDDELVHAHAPDEGRLEGAGGSVDGDARAVGGGAQDAVAVAEGNQADPAARGRHPGPAVRGRGAFLDDLDGGEGRAQGEGGDQVQVGGGGDGGVGAEAVQADAGAHHVVVRLGVPQDPGGGGQVADARRDARVGEDRQALFEDAHVGRGRGVARLAGVVGSRHVAPRADDVDEAFVGRHAQGRGQGGQVGQGRARAGHAGVDLDVDAGGAANLSGGRADVRKDPGPRHGQVDVGLDGGRKV